MAEPRNPSSASHPPPGGSGDDLTMPRGRRSRSGSADTQSALAGLSSPVPGKGSGDTSEFSPTVPRSAGRKVVSDTEPDAGVPETHTQVQGLPPASSIRPPEVINPTEPYFSDDEHAPPAALGHYKLGEELGRGGMGIVCTATDLRLGRRVAIKRLRANRTGRTAADGFLEEAQITAQLEHPGIVPVHELGNDPTGRPWLAMKHVSGQTLSDQIREWNGVTKRGRLAPALIREMISVIQKVSDAIAFAHDHGVIHRDLKPSNVMVGRYGEVMVMDWGLARPLGREGGDRESLRERTRPIVATDRRSGNAALTMEGDVFGTPACMAPEQARGRVNDVDERTDVFALGGLLYHMLTGEAPYVADTMLVVLGKALRHDLIPPPRRSPQRGIPRELAAIVMKAMAEQPADRYPSAQAFQADLRAWLDHRRTTAFRPGPITSALKWTRRHPTTSIVCTLLVVFVSVLGSVIGVMQAAQTALKADEAAKQAEERERTIVAREQAANAEHARQQEELRSALLAGELDQLRTLLKLKVETKRDAAMVEFQEAINKLGDESSHEAFVANLGPGKIDQLIAAYDALFVAHDKAPDTIPVSMQDFENRGLLYFYGTRKFQAAVDDFTRVIAADPDDKDSLIYRGYSLMQLGRFDEARKDFEHGLTLHDGPHFRIAMGNLAANQHNHSEAVRWYTEALAQEPGNAICLMNRGNAWYHQGQFDKAIVDHTAAIRALPTFARAYLNRAMAHLAAGRQEPAVEDLGRAIMNDPEMPETYRTRAEIRLQLGQWAAAAEDCTLALARQPDPDSWLFRGQARLRLNDIDGGISDIRQSLAMRNDPEVWFDLAQLLLKQEDYPAAAAAYTEVLKTEPGWAEAYVNRGIAYRRSNDNKSALADFRQAAAHKPGLYQAWMNQGIVLCDLRQLDGPEGARAAFDRAIEVVPEGERARVRAVAAAALESARGD